MNTATATLDHYTQLRRLASAERRLARRRQPSAVRIWTRVVERITERLVRWGERAPAHRAGAFDRVGHEKRLLEVGACYLSQRATPFDVDYLR